MAPDNMKIKYNDFLNNTEGMNSTITRYFSYKEMQDPFWTRQHIH